MAAPSNPLHVLLHLAACLYPAGLLDRSRQPSARGLTDPLHDLPGPAAQAMHRLWQLRYEAENAPLILTGDQIYADATAGLADPTARLQPHASASLRLLHDYWVPRTFSKNLGTVLRLMDDHEIADNHEPSANCGRQQRLEAQLVVGRRNFINFQRKLQAHPGAGANDTRLWYADHALLQGRLLFVGDTRSERQHRDPAHLDIARIMSPEQDTALKHALVQAQASQAQAHKFIATPSMLLPRRLSTAEDPASPAAALRSDAWDGYPRSLHGLLAWIANQQIQRCVFLSGDEHLPNVTEATVESLDDKLPAVTLWSVHAGALYAPYPFANAVAADFAEEDCFCFSDPDSTKRYRCTVRSWFPPAPGDGFLQVRTDDSVADGTTGLAVQFHAAGGRAPGADWAWPQGAVA